MLYQHQELLEWLKVHNLINITKLEFLAKIPKDTLRHFIKERRDISPNQYNSIQEILFYYGFKPHVTVNKNLDINNLPIAYIRPVSTKK